MRISGRLGPMVIAGLSCMLSAGGCGDDAANSADDVIRIGVFLREGGDSADEVLAVREINAAGGITIDGKSSSLELVRLFDGASASGGVQAVERFVDEGVVAAIGPRWSSIVLGARADHSDGAAQAAIEQGLLIISGNATSAAISTLDDDDLIWRTIPSDDIQGQVGARYAYVDRGARTAAVLYRDDAWGRGLSATFAESFEALGGAIFASVSYDPELDFDGYAFPELERLLLDRPEVVYLLSFNETAQVTLRAVQGGHLDGYGDALPLFIATDGSFDRGILTNAAPEVLARFAGTVPGPSPDNATFAAYLDAFEDADLGPREDAWPYPYDAVYLIALAVQAAQSTDSRDIKRHLREVSRRDDGDVSVSIDDWAEAREALEHGEGVDYDGASGAIELTAQGDPSAGYISIWEVAPNDQGELEFAFDPDKEIEFQLTQD